MWAALGAGLCVAVAVGCSASTSVEPAQTAAPATTDESADIIKAALVTGIGDTGNESFSASCVKGLDRATKDFGLVTTVVESTSSIGVEASLTKLSGAGYDPIFIAASDASDAVAKVAIATPWVTYCGIGEFYDPPIANTIGLHFKEQEAGYLAGVLAGTLTTRTSVDRRINGKKVIGFVGGRQTPVVRRYAAGFIAGAKKANPAVAVRIVYTGSPTSQKKGGQAARALIGRGADIIFAAADRSSVGCAEACRDKGALFIGADTDQALTIPGIGDTIITSAVTKVDNAVYDTVTKYIEGTLVGGRNVAYGIKEDGVGLSPYHKWKSRLPADVKEAVEKAAAEVVSGVYTVPEV
jgi:basic membrane protein A